MTRHPLGLHPSSEGEYMAVVGRNLRPAKRFKTAKSAFSWRTAYYKKHPRTKIRIVSKRGFAVQGSRGVIPFRKSKPKKKSFWF